MSTLLKLKKINLKYQTGKDNISVLKDINLTTKKKETISIVGESGSGKTSLIMLIGGLERPTSGKIYFQDHEITKLSEDEISKMLGVTQAAVSNYIRGIRGDPKLIEKLLQEEQVVTMINEITDNLASDKAYTPSSLSKFIGLCNYIKSSLLICDIHHNLESDIDDEVCKECENMLLKGPGSVY